MSRVKWLSNGYCQRGQAKWNKMPQHDTLSEPPEHFTESQKESWLYVLKHAPTNALQLIDRAILTVWVEAEDRHRIAMVQQTRLNANTSLPLLTKSKDGTPIPSPYLRIMTQAAETMLRVATELGFTPVTRAQDTAQPGAPPSRSGLSSFRWSDTNAESKVVEFSYKLPDKRR